MLKGSMWLAGVCVVALVGCKGGGSSSSSSGGGAGEFRQLIMEEYAAACAYEDRCATTRGPVYSSAAACTAAATALFEYYDQPSPQYGGQSFFQWAAARYTVDNARWQSCVGQIRGAACDLAINGDPGFTDPDCQDAIRFTGTIVAAGGSCADPTAVCARGLSCVPDPAHPDCRTCLAPKALNAGCNGDHECQSYFCSSGSCRTFPNIAQGGTCAATHECFGQLLCSQNKCTPRVALNGDCTSGPCLADDYCDPTTHTCREVPAAGAPCTADIASAPCLGGRLCVLSATTGLAGTCQDSASFNPGAGQPCGVLVNPGYVYPLCSYYGASNLYAKATQDGSGKMTACECVAFKPNGAACVSPAECSSGVCINTCVDKQPAGAACTYQNDCLSSRCESNHTCGAPLPPPVCDGSSSSSSSSSSSGGLADCTTRPANHAVDSNSTSTKASVDAVITAEFTLTSGAAKAGKYCGNADGHAYWWRLAGAVAATHSFHLVVTFDRGTAANDVDFEVATFDAAPATGYTTAFTTGNCHAVSGTNEDCVNTFSMANTDVYVKTATSTLSTTEGFIITLTKT